jgi:PPK2 family polyphosphate:nucleotide phosphotransferase
MQTPKWHKYRVTGDKPCSLRDYPTTAQIKQPDRDELELMLRKCREAIATEQNKLYAEGKQSILIVLQGMDSAGKDSLIKHIMSGVNPQGILVHSFKHPTSQELVHSYLWRHYLKLPEKGQITIFNRSHYENVLISKVHPEIVLAERIPGIDSVKDVNKKFWKQRYEQIIDFERVVIQNGTQIIKIFLHLSKNEQRKRFLERIENKEKHWKFSSDDISERQHWDQYQAAYEQAISHTSIGRSPWHIVPADDKWYTQLIVSHIIIDKLNDMNPKFPPVSSAEMDMMRMARERLEKE